MIANVIWNMKKTFSGSEPLTESRPTPSRKALERSPIRALPSLNASE